MLENILINYFNLNNVEVEWYDSYSQLIALMYDLQKLGVIDNADEIIDKLDFIDNMIE